jgi:hypothetical protein
MNRKKIKINYNIKDRVYAEKYKKKKELEQIKKKLNSPNNQTKKKLKKRKTNQPFYTPAKSRPKKRVVDYNVNFSFTPIINKKSKKIWEKRNKNLEANMNQTSNKNNFNNSTIRNKNINASISILLYNDAFTQKEKLKKRSLAQDNNIKSIANKKKMSKTSYNMVIERINKKMNNIIKKHSVNSKVSIVNIIQCLCDLKIINELIKSNQIIDLNIETIKDNIANINEKDQKKIQELELIEQLWFLINPTMEEYINNQLFFELLKILFSVNDNNINNNQIKELIKYIQNLLDKNNMKNKDEDEDKSNSELSLISPLRDKKFEKSSLWPISKIIKTFLQLKSNIKAYRSNEYEYKKEELSNNLKEEREKELKFEPDLSQSNNYVFKKNSKYNYYIDEYKQLINDDIYFYSYNYKKPKLDFNKIYERFMLQKKMHEKALEKLREIKRKKELKKCSNKPKITEYSPEQLNWSVDYENSKIYKRNNHING